MGERSRSRHFRAPFQPSSERLELSAISIRSGKSYFRQRQICVLPQPVRPMNMALDLMPCKQL